MSESSKIIQFPKKGRKTTAINLEVQTEILEDGGVWMRTKLNIDKEWGEWGRIQVTS